MTTANLPYPFSKCQITTGSVSLLKGGPDWCYRFTTTTEVLTAVKAIFFIPTCSEKMVFPKMLDWNMIFRYYQEK